MTTERNIIIHAGQTFTLSLDYAGTAGRGQRMHIRASDAAADVIAILTHNGDANARVIYDGTDSLDITIGASVNGGWLVGANRVEWVYDIEDYDLSDTDDVVIAYRGKAIVYGNRTRPEDVTPSAALPSGDGRYVRFDGVQGLTDAQKLQARENIGAGTGGSGSGDVVGPAGATDDRIAAFDGTTGKLIKQGSVTATAVASHLSSTSNPHSVTAAQVGADPAGTASTAVSTHAGAVDPHGDRAFATAAVGTHAAAAGAHPMSGVDGLAAALALLAPLLSPALTGTPTTPTAAPGTASTQIASTAFVAAAISALLNSAPGALDTLDELAAALGDDPNFATTVTNALAGKLAKASNLADLVDAAAARTNLGATTIGGQVFTAADAAAIRSLLTLGAAALLSVGTTAGTVAAGDDSRIVGAVQTSRNVSTQHSLTGGGDLSANRTLSLVNDTASPGNSKVYGTDASGVRGWYDGGGSPGGSGSELQYRGGASTFSAATGTHWDAINGRLSIGAGTSPAGMLHAQASAASVVPVVLSGAASQTASLQEWRDSAGNVVGQINVSGVLGVFQVSNSNGTSTYAQIYSTNTTSGTAYKVNNGSTGYIQFQDGYGYRVSTSIGGDQYIHQGFAAGVSHSYRWSSSSSAWGTADTSLIRVAAGIVGVRNGSTGGGALSLIEQTAPSAPSADGVYVYAEDNGSGKTRLMARFASGAAQQIAIEP